MYTAPQMPQESLPKTTTPFPSLWSLTLSTLNIWKSGWGIFSFINVCVVFLGAIVWFAIASVMPWLQLVLTGTQAVDESLIAAYYPTTVSLVTDLLIVCCILAGFTLCVFVSQIMTILAINPETRHKGLLHVSRLSLRLLPRYAWTVIVAGCIGLAGLSLLIIPGVLLIPLAIVSVFAATLEQTSGMQAVARGMEYTKGYVIEALWRSVVILLIIHAVSLILPLIAALPVYPFTLFDFSERTIRALSFTAGTLYTFISFVLSLILPSLLIIFYHHLYAHMKNHPSHEKPIDLRLIRILAWFGAFILIGLLALETFGI